MSTNVLGVNNVSKSYRQTGGWLGKRHATPVLKNISLTIEEGQIYGLVGRSGCGKSTLARLIVGLEKPDAGLIRVNNQCTHTISGRSLRALYRDVQMVFQDPTAALNPLQTVENIIAEPLLNFTTLDHASRRQSIVELLQDVKLSQRFLKAYPHQLSGGEKQRVCIARALAIRPKLIIFDESFSALDKSTQLEILRLLKELHEQYNASYLLISHDLAVITFLCNRIGVMLDGVIVEENDPRSIMKHSKHFHTSQLVEVSNRQANHLMHLMK